MFYPETKGRTLEEMDEIFHASLVRRHVEPVDGDTDTVLPKSVPQLARQS